MDRQVCKRCGGSGKFSYNLRDGDMCYGCNGAGYTVAGVATADLQTAAVGDTLAIGKVLYRADRVVWYHDREPMSWYNQALRLVRLVDDKAFWQFRTVKRGGVGVTVPADWHNRAVVAGEYPT